MKNRRTFSLLILVLISSLVLWGIPFTKASGFDHPVNAQFIKAKETEQPGQIIEIPVPNTPPHIIQSFQPGNILTFSPGSPVDEAEIAPQNQISLLLNGGVDTGQWYPWQTYGLPTLVSSNYFSFPYSALLGGRDNAKDAISQKAIVPWSTSQLDFSLRIGVSSQEVAASSDWFCYDFTDENFQETLIGGPYCSDLSNVLQNQWLSGQVTLSGSNLSPLVGKPIQLILFTSTDSSLPSSVLLDNITLTAITSGNAPSVYLPFVSKSAEAKTPTPQPPPSNNYCMSMWVQCSIYCGIDFSPDPPSCKYGCLEKYNYCLNTGVWP